MPQFDYSKMTQDELLSCLADNYRLLKGAVHEKMIESYKARIATINHC